MSAYSAVSVETLISAFLMDYQLLNVVVVFLEGELFLYVPEVGEAASQ